MSEEREILFVSKSLVDNVKRLGEIEGIMAEVKKLYGDMMKEIQIDKDVVEESISTFQDVANTAKEGLKSVLETEVEATRRLFDELETKRYEIVKQVEQVTKATKTAWDDLDKLRKAIESINTYRIEQVFELVERFNQMSDQDKELLAKIFAIGKEAAPID